MKKYNELIKKAIFTLAVILFFYIAQGIPVPGYSINFRLPEGTISLERMLSLTTGGVLSSPTLLALGIGPYMTVSILMSVTLFANRDLSAQLSLEERGRLEIVGIFFMSILQAIPLAFNLRSAVTSKISFLSTFHIFLFTILCFVVGALLVSWLASLNVIYGLGGPFILLLPGIIKGLAGGLGANYNSVLTHFDRLVIFLIISVLFVAITVAIYLAEYRFDIQRIGLDKHSKESYIAFRLLIAGSMPLMFATTLTFFPYYVMKLFNIKNEAILSIFNISNLSGILVYGIILYLLGILFSFINIMPDQIAKNLKESGDYILGITPGEDTKRYISKRVWGIALIGNLFLPVIVTVPLLVGFLTNHQSIFNMSNYFVMFFVLVVIYDNLQQDIRFLLYKNNYDLFGTNRRNFG
ncbi:Preprotein translocase secY subunit [Lactococcus cremoris]|uniref:Preprotein translocase secY subunit n=1 Tax=Lactococcus lactis subsp. cremoris TaxID=1359 RepID=A0A166KKB1_LACLC|nr:preprotein translocase subunit SecY [Lactococcus cremoris]KZK08514.1 Preprotein translocase secY subunit [Lactococcus cremoris]